MSITDVGVMLSFLAMVAVVAKMLRAFRLLEARVTLLQEEVERSHGAARKAAPPVRATTRTPVLGVPTVSAGPPSRTVPADARTSDDTRPPSAAGADPTDDEVAWAWLVEEQERLKRAMGRDFRGSKAPRSAVHIRGAEMPDRPATRVLSAREAAAKIERR